jgi:hypothetical protein
MAFANPVQLPSDVGSTLLERGRAQEVVVFKGKEVKDSSDVLEDILAECFVEWERLLTRARSGRGYKPLPSYCSAWVRWCSLDGRYR